MALTETSPPTVPPPLAEQMAQVVRPVVWAADRTLPVHASMKGLFPEGGLRRGSTVVVSGSTSLALATMAAASAEGSWCAAVAFPSLGLSAAAELGVQLDRLALVPHPGGRWATVVAALVDSLDVVLVRPHGAVRYGDARRLLARARESGSVLVVVVDDQASWPQADIRLACHGVQWQGLGDGYGVLKRQQLRVVVEGRGAASRSRQALVSLAAA